MQISAWHYYTDFTLKIKLYSAEATVRVGIVETGGIIFIFPDTILSSHWLPLPYILFIFSDQGGFEQSSSLSFNPEGDITNLFTISLSNIMINFIMVNVNVEGQHDVLVSNGSGLTHLKEDGLTVNMLPWILKE